MLLILQNMIDVKYPYLSGQQEYWAAYVVCVLKDVGLNNLIYRTQDDIRDVLVCYILRCPFRCHFGAKTKLLKEIKTT